MTTKQKEIAVQAIARKRAQTYGLIQEEVSRMMGIGESEVKDTLDYLVSEHVLKEAATPTLNRAADPLAEREITWAWYEKGEMWPKD